MILKRKCSVPSHKPTPRSSTVRVYPARNYCRLAATSGIDARQRWNRLLKEFPGGQALGGMTSLSQRGFMAKLTRLQYYGDSECPGSNHERHNAEIEPQRSARDNRVTKVSRRR